jgi:hypothetical protein
MCATRAHSHAREACDQRAYAHVSALPITGQFHSLWLSDMYIYIFYKCEGGDAPTTPTPFPYRPWRLCVSVSSFSERLICNCQTRQVRFDIYIGTAQAGSLYSHAMGVRLVDPMGSSSMKQLIIEDEPIACTNSGFILNDQLFEFTPAGIDKLIDALYEAFGHLDREFTTRTY